MKTSENGHRMKSIVFSNIKGGVGKTTSVHTLGNILVKMFNQRVLLVDLDPQSNLTSALCTEDNNFEERISRLLRGDIYVMENSISKLLIDPGMDIHDCIRKTKYENLDILPSDLQLTVVEEQIKADVSSPQQFRLKKQLDKVKDEYDFCLMDLSPSVSLINVNGLAAADEVYIPIRPDGYSLEGLAFAKNLVDTVSQYNENLKLQGCFFTAWENYNCPNYLYEILNKYLPNLLLPIKINKSILLSENTVLQEALYELDHGKNMSKATKAYLQLAEYIMAEDKSAYLSSIA